MIARSTVACPGAKKIDGADGLIVDAIAGGAAHRVGDRQAKGQIADAREAEAAVVGSGFRRVAIERGDRDHRGDVVDNGERGGRRRADVVVGAIDRASGSRSSSPSTVGSLTTVIAWSTVACPAGKKIEVPMA